MERPRNRLLCAAALLWSGIVLLLHLVAGQLVCFGDTSTCAHGRDKDTLYLGTLTNPDGTRLVETPFTVAFASRENEQRVGGLRTDASGGYCVVWAYERGAALAYAGTDTRQTETASIPLEIRDPPLPKPPGCVTPNEGVPWNRSDDVTRTWPFLLLPLVAVTAIAVLLTALIRGSGPRPGIALTGAVSALWIGLWLL